MNVTSTSGRRPRRIAVAAAVLLLLLAALWGLSRWALSQPAFGGRAAGERLARMQADPHHHGERFANPQPPAAYRAADVWTLFSGQFLGDEDRAPSRPPPVVTVDAAALAAPVAPQGLRAFWIGHAAVYIEIDGVRLLADPMFSTYASPFDVGPKRLHPTPIALDALPAIDAVLITHDHYDHLDMRSVQRLAQRGAAFYVPLGIGAHLEAWGIAASQIHELTWWQEQSVRGVRVVSTPARHYSGRGLSDGDATLWTSWSIVGPAHRAFVSGDTGYSPHFREIGERYGPFDLSFTKIGAYGPTDHWHDIHMSPEEAVQAQHDLRASRLFPVHWATFNLAFHDWDEPIRRTLTAAGGPDGMEVLTPRIGEIVDIAQTFRSTAWWEAVR